MSDHYIAALDIGGTKIAATIADRSGPLLRLTQATPLAGSPRTLAEQCIGLVESVCARLGVASGEVREAGVSSCGPFVLDEGMIALVSPNLCGAQPGAADLPNDWDMLPLEQVLRERFASVVIRNDCIAALAAERNFGAVQDEADCVYVTWSTGIGFGLCVDGHILGGKHGNAGHAGHMLLTDQSDALCGCGNRGDVESLVSGRNLARRFGRDVAALFAAAREGSGDEYEVVAQAARWLGRALYNVAATLDTRSFVMGGSVWLHHRDWLTPLLMQEIEGRLPALTGGVRLLPAALGPLVADIGALCPVLPDGWAAHWRATRPWIRLNGD